MSQTALARKPRQRTRATPKKPPLRIRTITLSEQDEERLDRVAKDLTDYTGRAVSRSSVLRAFAGLADHKGYQWTLTELAPFVESELATGCAWGYHGWK